MCSDIQVLRDTYGRHGSQPVNSDMIRFDMSTICCCVSCPAAKLCLNLVKANPVKTIWQDIGAQAHLSMEAEAAETAGPLHFLVRRASHNQAVAPQSRCPAASFLGEKKNPPVIKILSPFRSGIVQLVSQHLAISSYSDNIVCQDSGYESWWLEAFNKLTTKLPALKYKNQGYLLQKGFYAVHFMLLRSSITNCNVSKCFIHFFIQQFWIACLPIQVGPW